MHETGPTSATARRPQFDLGVEVTANGVTHIAAAGELDMATVPQLEECIEAQPRTGCLVLDLSAVTFLDSTALSLILRLHAEAQSDGWKLRLVPGSEEVQRVFQLVDLERRLPFV